MNKTLQGVEFLDFKYSIYHVEKIIWYLHANHGDLAKVFDIVWSEVFGDYSRACAPQVLRLLMKVKHIVDLDIRKPEDVWERIVLENTITDIL